MTETETTTEPEQSTAWVLYDTAEPDFFPAALSPWRQFTTEQRAAERQARQEERQKAEERALRAERRQDMLTELGEQWSWAQGKVHDPQNPFRDIPSAEQQQDWDEQRELAEMRRNARRALEQAGLPPSLLKSAYPEPPADVPSLPPPDPELVADAQLARLEERTRRARIRHKISRILRPTAAVAVPVRRSGPAVAGRSEAAPEYVTTPVERGFIVRGTTDPGRVIG